MCGKTACTVRCGSGRKPASRANIAARHRRLPPTRPQRGLDETLTVTALGLHPQLRRTLQSTNPCESMIEIVRHVQRNVKRWQPGDMALRWTAAGEDPHHAGHPPERRSSHPRDHAKNSMGDQKFPIQPSFSCVGALTQCRE